eukprot:CAMPEP_0113245328 /NCGR_PEP_ID=MMETSP0008_2-20120614/8874_1 /TAXON_ID=97485 /ORGANISM="Prymnesium parvum" /LENGTH=82 /DNA_ID=CAMNT_0000093001 /DNA_START=41 /DNA_END=287 /DNA_ORIENTATION=+ /assembly_acc=CAM_ASM_000153
MPVMPIIAARPLLRSTCAAHVRIERGGQQLKRGEKGATAPRTHAVGGQGMGRGTHVELELLDLRVIIADPGDAADVARRVAW